MLCRAERAVDRYFGDRQRVRVCVTCGKKFSNGGHGRYKNCSAECSAAYRVISERDRRRRYNEENRERRRVYDREYLKLHPDRHAKWARDNPEKVAINHLAQRHRKMAQAEARRKAKRLARDRHADIWLAARQVDAWRWHEFGTGFRRQVWINRPNCPEPTPEHREEQKKKHRRLAKQRQRAAYKIAREMGLPVTKRDRDCRWIYRALKAELPNLNLKG